MKNSHQYQLALWLTPGIGPERYHTILTHLPDLSELFNSPAKELEKLKLPDKTIQALKNPDWETVEKQLKWADEKNHDLLKPTDLAYPKLLKEIADPPPFLFVDGELDCLQENAIAMVGSRHATPQGKEVAFEWAEALAKAGFIIVSGLALGIDGASHQGALKAGKTIAVLGSGINKIYPSSHAKLAEKIRENGAIISEFPLNTAPIPGNFPRRNRIISGLSRALIVVEASLKSGSLITAKFALEQGREVFAIPGAINNPFAKGCHHLLKQGASLAESVSDICKELELSQPKMTLTQADKLEKPLKALLSHIDYTETPLEIIQRRSHLPIDQLAEGLLTLELRQYIRNESGNYRRIQ